MTIPNLIQKMKQAAFLVLFALLAISVFAQQQVVRLNPTAGAYSETTYVELQSETGSDFMYRFAGSSDETWIDYVHPLRLSALDGEERIFTIQVKTASENGENISSYRYTIDKRAPLAPELSLNKEDDGFYVEFMPPENGTKVKYWLSSFAHTAFTTWNGESPQVAPDTIVKAYCEDAAGNISEISTLKVDPDVPCGASTPDIEVASPVSGSFANAQWLVIRNAHCYEWVRYSTNSNEPRRNGSVYDEPVLIEATGQIELKIQAKPFRSNNIYSQSIQYTVTEPGQNLLDTFSPLEYGGAMEGIDYYPQPLNTPGTELYYSLNDTQVTTNHPQLTSPVKVKTSEGMRNFVPYRIGVYDLEASKMHQYRYFFIFDRRIPANPLISIQGELPFKQSIRIGMRSSADAAIYYTIDGSTPDRFSNRYTGPISVNSAETAKLGVIPVQAVARYENGNSSEVVRRLLPYDREVPPAPSYQIVQADSTGADIRISHPDEETEIVYAIGYGETPLLQINADSPVISRELRVDFPAGYQGGAFLRFAARDKAGNLSSSTATVKVNVDSVPPPPPAISRRDNSISFEADEGTVFYRIKPLYTELQEYSQAIELETSQGERKEYTIDYFAQDDQGNRSVQKTEQIVIDKRIPSAPEFTHNTGTNISNRFLAIRCIPPYPDALVYYQLYRFNEEGALEESSGSQLPAQEQEPGFNDTQYSQPIQLVGSENREITYLLKARSYLPTADSWSTTARAEFTIDKKPPILPEMKLIIGRGIFSDPVTLNIAEPAENQNTWIYVEEVTSDSAEAGKIDLSKITRNGTLLSRGAVISGTQGQETRYRAFVAAVDSAGNTALSEAAEFTIDRKRPEPPELRGLPSQPETGGPIEIFAPTEYRDKIVYELSTDGSSAPQPDSESPVLGPEPISLEPAKEAAHTRIYSIAYRGIDQAGNMSTVKNAIFRISKKTPAPPKLDLAQIGDQHYLLKVTTEKENQVHIRLDDGEFEIVEKDYLFLKSQRSLAFEIGAYTQNSYGQRSETVTRRLSSAQSNLTLVNGIENGGLYKRDITISPADTDMDIRYELATRNTNFETLGPNSPSMFDSLSLEVSSGQTEHYELSVGVYDAESNTVFAKQTYRFTIDKAAPLPPEIVGIQSDYHYTEDQTVRILPRDDATVYFRSREVSGPETPFRQYVQPEKVRVRGGTRKDIIVEAWSEDQAGNQSRMIRREFVIDKASIYVAPNGKDAFSGGKENPFQSIDRALYEAHTTNRNTIYLAAGEYKVSNPIAIQNQLNIIGGLDENTWKLDTSARTFLSIGANFTASKPLFSVRQGSLKLENLSLSNIDLENALCVQEGEYSTLIIRNSTILHANGNAPTIIWSKNGNFVLHNSVIEVGPVRNGSILRIDDTESVLRSSVITSNSASGMLTLLNLKGSDIEILDTELMAERSESIRIINAVDAQVEIENSALMYGAGEVRSTGIIQTGGKQKITKTHIGNGSRPAHIATGIEIDNVNAQFNGLTLEGNAALGLVQIRSNNSSLSISSSTLRNKGTREFSYLLRTYGGSCSVKDSELKADSSYDVYGIELHDNSVALLQNSLLELQAGENNTYGVIAEGPVVCTVQESRLRVMDGAAGSDAGNAAPQAVVQETSSADIKLVNNRFSGWNILLKTPARSARSIEELEAEVPPFDQRTPHRGNRVE